MKTFAASFTALSLALSIASSAGTLPCSALEATTAVTAAAPTSVTTAPSSSPEPWWKHAVLYEIYPRSFADADNNGMGDIAGITAKLDYLKDLGVDAIWITPCYPSPQVDFGYDISDYCAIAPEYGSMADFDKLIAEAKKRNIKIMMDLVLNHTSYKHPWFQESASSKNNPKRDWYVWRDGKNGEPPNNWQSVFGHSAWKLDPKTNQYYYHMFYAEQPDLNWRNPEVRKAMYDGVRFWLDKGVAGFRLDAISTLFEDPKLADNPTKPGQKNRYGDPEMTNENNDNLAEVHDVLRELRKLLDSYPDHRVLVGECWTKDPAGLVAMYGKDLDEIQLPMNFYFADVNKLSAPEFRKVISAADSNPVHGWPVYLFSNHDQPRHYVRYGDNKNNDDIAKLTSTMLMTLRGTPIMYYGEEIGMTNRDPERVEDVRDPIGKIGWPQEKGRDGERTPMQWSAATNSGFSTATPWLPVTSNYTTHNVEKESKDPGSLLSWYKSLIQLRRTNTALVNGEYVSVNNSDEHVLSYLRRDKNGKSVLVALNMSDAPRSVSYDLNTVGIKGTQAKTLLTSDKTIGETTALNNVKLAPYSTYIAEVE